MNKIEITNNAQDHIASILEKDSAAYFRITVLGGGCAGFQYKFDFENLKNDDDILIEEEKINVVIDETSMELIQNSTIDYVHELIGSSFKITNPQASSSPITSLFHPLCLNVKVQLNSRTHDNIIERIVDNSKGTELDDNREFINKSSPGELELASHHNTFTNRPVALSDTTYRLLSTACGMPHTGS